MYCSTCANEQGVATTSGQTFMNDANVFVFLLVQVHLSK